MGKPATAEERREAMRVALAGLAAGLDVDELAVEVSPLLRKNDVFPRDVFVELAADALEIAAVSRDNPFDYAGLRERYLPEYQFRGKTDHLKSHTALRAAAMLHGGVRPDLGDDAGWWQLQNFPFFALYALVIYMRVAAERTGETPAAIAARIGSLHGLDIVCT